MPVAKPIRMLQQTEEMTVDSCSEPELVSSQSSLKVSNHNQRKTYTAKGQNVNQITPKHRNSISGRTPLSPGYGAVVSALSNLSRLDDFVLEPIAKGFFSDVSKVWHRTSGEVMVLKMNTRYDNRANVVHEVELLNRLTHKNIVRFKGVCVHNGQLHALTEYVNGGDLQQVLLDTNFPLPWELRMGLSQDVAEGMNYVHSKGYIHRDLTAMNILVRKEGYRLQGVIADFGLATTIPSNNERRSVAGSPYWMAPECLHHEFFNEKADIFSFGIILCQVIARIQADPQWLPRLKNFALDEEEFRFLATDCPENFLQLAYRCCEMEFEQRPSFDQIADILKKMLNKLLEDKANQNSTRFRNKNEFRKQQRARTRTSVSQLDVQLPSDVRSYPLTRSNSARLSKHMECPHFYIKNSSNPFDTPDLKGRTKIMASPQGSALEIPPKLSAMFEQLHLNKEYFGFGKNRRKSISLPSSPVLKRRTLFTEDDPFEECNGPNDVKAVLECENIELTHRLISWQERKHSVKSGGSEDWEIEDSPHYSTVAKEIINDSVTRYDSGVSSLYGDDATPSHSSHGSVDDAFSGATWKRNSTGE